METNWRQSQLYRKRQSELDEVIAQCQRFQINPKIDGFIAHLDHLKECSGGSGRIGA